MDLDEFTTICISNVFSLYVFLPAVCRALTLWGPISKLEKHNHYLTYSNKKKHENTRENISPGPKKSI